jgi:hypothetical protein
VIDNTLPLFAWRPPVSSPSAPEQAHQLARVEKGLAVPILAWCRAHAGQDFSLNQITAAITGHHACAPDSVRRILLQLRHSGHVEVELLDRARSLYRLGVVRG